MESLLFCKINAPGTQKTAIKCLVNHYSSSSGSDVTCIKETGISLLHISENQSCTSRRDPKGSHRKECFKIAVG